MLPKLYDLHEMSGGRDRESAGLDGMRNMIEEEFLTDDDFIYMETCDLQINFQIIVWVPYFAVVLMKSIGNPAIR